MLLSHEYYAEKAIQIPDVEEVSGPKGKELSRTPIELKSGEWVLKVVPWIGGRIISMMHIPSGKIYSPLAMYLISNLIWKCCNNNYRIPFIFPCDLFVLCGSH